MARQSLLPAIVHSTRLAPASHSRSPIYQPVNSVFNIVVDGAYAGYRNVSEWLETDALLERPGRETSGKRTLRGRAVFEDVVRVVEELRGEAGE